MSLQYYIEATVAILFALSMWWICN